MSDYDRIARAIDFILDKAGEQPTLETIAAHVHLSPFHFQRLFSRWAGVSPKRFLQYLTVERAKALLNDAAPLLEVSQAVGLSGTSRLHDSFVSIEALSPGEFKRRGRGIAIDYGVHQTPFGRGFVAATARGICKFSFLEEGTDMSQPLAELEHSWPQARLSENPPLVRELLASMFTTSRPPDRPLSLLVTGTNFQINVWKALLRIPPGALVSFGQLAAALGHPRSARAVGNAVARNPVGFLIPCHRVIRDNGCIGDYHWGVIRKYALHAWESAALDRDAGRRHEVGPR
jgi:AraC family transcriptional regulator of adaptative response/methylated-DNA-[protein]-cysteine methyltransferase